MRVVRLLACLLLGTVLPAHHVRAQSHQRTVEGRVQRPVERGGDSTGMGAAANTWVTLHRVGRDSAGPVDSARTSVAGRYRLQWRVANGDSAVYFASVTWNGIAYFSAPLRNTDARGDDAEITVFDTTSRVFPLTIKGRHLIVGAADTGGVRTVIEVFELSNDSLRTLVSLDDVDSVPTWSMAVPSAALNVRVTQGDVPAEAFAHRNGRAEVFAPVAPGLKQVAFSYQMPPGAFPIQYLAHDGAVVFEVLMEEEQAAVFGSGFQRVEAVTLEGRRFERFLAQDVVDGSQITVEVPGADNRTRNYTVGLLVAVGFLVLLLLTRTMQRRTRRNVSGQGSTTDAMGTLRGGAAANASNLPMDERLKEEIRGLDQVYSRLTAPSDSVRQAYEARRAELTTALDETLASRSQSR